MIKKIRLFFLFLLLFPLGTQCMDWKRGVDIGLGVAAVYFMAKNIYTSWYYPLKRAKWVVANDPEALLKACETEDYDKVKLFITLGCSLEERNECQETPLHIAVRKDNLEIVDLLIKSGADIDAVDYKRRTCFYKLEEDNSPLAKLLLDAGVDPNSSDIEGAVPLHVAAVCGFERVAKLLIERGALLNAADSSLYTPLHCAAHEGLIRLALLLVRSGAEMNLHTSNGNTPLGLAIMEGRVDCAKALIMKGADVHSANGFGVTPLYLATYFGQTELAKFLLNKNVEVNVYDDEGQGPLLLAALKGELELVKALIEKGAEVNALAAIPLSEAAQVREDIAQLLSDFPELSDELIVNSSLSLAVHGGHLEVVKELLLQGADINARGISLMDYVAPKKNDLAICRMLLDYGVEINTKAYLGCSPLWLSICSGNSKLAKYLLFRGASVNSINLYGENDLHISILKNYPELSTLLMLFADKFLIYKPNMAGITPLQLAQENGLDEVVALFQGKGSDLIEKAQHDFIKFVAKERAKGVGEKIQGVHAGQDKLSFAPHKVGENITRQILMSQIGISPRIRTKNCWSYGRR